MIKLKYFTLLEEDNLKKDKFIIAKKKFVSRLIVGTGKYKSMSECAKAIKFSGAEIVTVAVRRVNISNIYKREEFRHKSLISDVVTGGIFGLGADGYILAIISMQKLLKK